MLRPGLLLTGKTRMDTLTHNWTPFLSIVLGVSSYCAVLVMFTVISTCLQNHNVSSVGFLRPKNAPFQNKLLLGKAGFFKNGGGREGGGEHYW